MKFSLRYMLTSAILKFVGTHRIVFRNKRILYKVFKGLHHEDWLDYHFKELKVTERKKNRAKEKILHPQLY